MYAIAKKEIWLGGTCQATVETPDGFSATGLVHENKKVQSGQVIWISLLGSLYGSANCVIFSRFGHG